MRSFAVVVVVFLLAGYSSCSADEEMQYQVLAFVPMLQEKCDINIDDITPSYRWQRGWEVIRGATAAVEIINSEGIFPYDFLELIPIDEDMCDNSFDGLTSFIRTVLHQETKVVSVMGLFCPKIARLILPLASRLDITLQFSGSLSPLVFDDDTYPDLPLKISEGAVIRTLIEFIENQDLTRLGVIVDLSDILYFDTVGSIRRLIEDRHYNVTITDHILINQDIDIEHVMTSLASDINLVSMGIRNTFEILCEAYRANKSWPSNLWIVTTHREEDILLYHSEAAQWEVGCSAENVMEGIVFVHQPLEPENHTIPLAVGLTYEELVSIYYNTSISRVNPYTNLLFDAVWDVALSLNGSALLNETGPDLTNITHFNSRVSGERPQTIGDPRVIIYQIRNGRKHRLATYREDSEVLTYSERLEFTAATVKAKEKSWSPLLFAIFYTDTAIWFVFVSIVLALFCWFRNEDSIKSTSLYLSFLMFAGCYAILSYTLVSDLYYAPQYELFPSYIKQLECVFRVWMHALGLPSMLILGTLLVKIARVYHIFLSLDKIRFVSNCALCIYIGLIMIPNVTVMALWTGDIAFNRDTSNANEATGLERCRTPSSRLYLWLFLLFLYFLLLSGALITVAVLTRKIRYQNFKDTKKVNALIFFLLYTFCFVLGYWGILQGISSGSSNLGRLTLHVGHVLIVAECMVLLFIPKVYSPLRKKFST